VAIVHTAGFRPRLYRESPWYDTIAGLLARFDEDARFPSPEELTDLYAEQTRARDVPPLRFVASVKSRKKRPRRAPIELASLYEGSIVERGEVPTRVDDWHDFFNALAFVSFPRAKRALHARQYAIVRARLGPHATRLPNARTREQDALSLFDEGGLVVVVSSPERAAELAEADDDTLGRALAASAAHVIPFGHALYEHMVAGLACPLATAHVIIEPSARESPDWLARVDAALARTLEDPLAFQLPSSARGNSLERLLEHTLTR
jgi:hypothetical protein